MAGVRLRKDRKGKPRYYEGWFMDWKGKQRFFKGTTNRRETLGIARRYEDHHRKIKLGELAEPRESDVSRSFREVADEYLAWGNAQGGQRGRPWSATHAKMRRRLLEFWEDRLALKNLHDLEGCLPQVEKVLQELYTQGKSGKTIQNCAEGISCFCVWCTDRGYFERNPLERLVRFDTTPRSTRRALTPEEITRLLAVCSPSRRLLYETAICTGLRAGELRALRVANLDIERSGLRLEAAWTKNRQDGFQQIPAWLAAKLTEEAKGKKQNDPLLNVPDKTAYELNKDLSAANIPKQTEKGKIDFHALRVAYVSIMLESGASAKEAQTLARHNKPELTMNVYARTRESRLAEVAEKVGEIVSGAKSYGDSMAQPIPPCLPPDHNSSSVSGLHAGMSESPPLACHPL